FLGDDLGLVVLAIASPVNNGDGTEPGRGREVVEHPRLFGFGQLQVVPSLKLLPALRVMAEPLAELGARAEVSFPRVELQMLLRPSTRPDAVDQHAASVIRT